MTEIEQVYKKYFKDVFLYVKRLSGNEHIAEEISSETFFRAMQSLDKFRGDCDVCVWLCQIAKNCYYSYLKKDKRTSSIDEVEIAEIPDTEESLEEQLLRRDDTERIQIILHEIPEPYREVFMWRVFAELNFKQIGQIFHKSDNWACVTYHRARNMIKERLEDSKYEKGM